MILPELQLARDHIYARFMGQAYGGPKTKLLAETVSHLDRQIDRAKDIERRETTPSLFTEYPVGRES